MSDLRGPNMSRAWNLEFGTKLLGIIRAERNRQMANNEWEAYEAYTTGNRSHIGFNRFYLESEALGNGERREYISAIANDGNHYIFRPGHPQYEEIKAKASPAEV